MLPYLTPESITRGCAEAGLDAEIERGLQAAALCVMAAPELLAAVATAHYGTYHAGNTVTSETWQSIETLAGDQADAIFGVLALDSVRLVRERHGRRGIPPESYTQLHVRHAQYLINEHRRKTARIGVTRSYLFWFGIVASGYLCRVGILEFYIMRSYFDVHVYAHKRSGDVIALSAGDVGYNDDGYCLEPHTWRAQLVVHGAGTTGSPISPLGFAQRQTVTLPASDWERVIAPGDWMLDMHIPEGNTLHEAELRASLLEAEHFFPRFFPECGPHRAYFCNSWLFSTQIEDFLGDHSRIVRWQRQHYLFPLGNAEDGAYSFKSFAYADSAIDLTTAARDTRLRRAIVDHARAGGKFRCGGAFLLRQDINQFGATPYRGKSSRAIAQLATRAGDA
jgi:hypothetical protein